MRLYATEMSPSPLQIAIASRAFTGDYGCRGLLMVIPYENHEYFFFNAMEQRKFAPMERKFPSSTPISLLEQKTFSQELLL